MGAIMGALPAVGAALPGIIAGLAGMKKENHEGRREREAEAYRAERPTAPIPYVVSAAQNSVAPPAPAPGNPLASPKTAIDAATRELTPQGGVRDVEALKTERRGLGALQTPRGLTLPQGMTPLQTRSYIASQGTYGQNPAYKSPETVDYLRKLGLQGLMGDTGDVTGSLMPVEGQYFNRLVGKHPSDALDYLFGLGEYNTRQRQR